MGVRGTSWTVAMDAEFIFDGMDFTSRAVHRFHRWTQILENDCGRFHLR
jgi:hypothetical protein